MVKSGESMCDSVHDIHMVEGGCCEYISKCLNVVRCRGVFG